MSTTPEILFLDELTANLDEDTAWDLFLFLEELNLRGTTVIMASHAKRFINLMRRRVVTLVDGRILWRCPAGALRQIWYECRFTIWRNPGPPRRPCK